MIGDRKKQRIIIASVFLFLACGALITFRAISRRDKGPVYEGVTLEQWIKQFHSASITAPGSIKAQKERDQAESAIHAIGTNAIPYLLRWMDYDEPNANETARFIINGSLRDVGLGKVEVGSSKNARAFTAFFALPLFSSDAKNIVPELTRMLQNPRNNNPENCSYRAGYLLTQFGNAGAKALAANLTNQNPVVQETAVYHLGRMREQAAIVVPALITALDSENPNVVQEAIKAIGSIEMDPALCVPKLIDRMGRVDFPFKITAALALGKFGSNALTAVPLLVKIRDESKDPLRKVCVKSLHRINPSAYTNAPPEPGPYPIGAPELFFK